MRTGFGLPWGEDGVGPRLLGGSERTTGLIERLFQHLPPSRGIGEGDRNRMLHECRNVRGSSRGYQGANLGQLLIWQRNRDLSGRHTVYHTSWEGKARLRAPGCLPACVLTLSRARICLQDPACCIL